MPDGADSISRRSLVAGLLAAVLALPSAPALADDGGGGGGNDGGGHDGGDDGGGHDDGGDDGGGNDSGNTGSSSSGPNDRVLKAVTSGRAAPLKDILAMVKSKYDGDIVRVKLDRSGKAMVYNIRILGKDNKLVDVQVDARTRTFLPAGVY